MRMWMRKTKHGMPIMYQHRMWRIESRVLESVKIVQYISDL